MAHKWLSHLLREKKKNIYIYVVNDTQVYFALRTRDEIIENILEKQPVITDNNFQMLSFNNSKMKKGK